MLTICISSQALFDMRDANEVFVNKGPDAYDDYMRRKEKVTLKKGVMFGAVEKMLNMNDNPDKRDKVEFILLSRSSAHPRILNSLEFYRSQNPKFYIERASFTQGKDRFKYAKAFNADLFLSTNPTEVRAALDAGLAAGTVMPHSKVAGEDDGIVRWAFDGDAVLFSDEAEKVNKESGLQAFQASEKEKARIPLPAGPFKKVLLALSEIQRAYPRNDCPMRLALVTARGTPAHERALRTVRSWGISLDEVILAGGLPKGPFLEAYGADLFFDDTPKNIDNAVAYVTSAHVPSGVVNLMKAAA